MHLLEKAHDPWASPLVVVSKGDGNFRVCADYVRVNSLTVKDAFPSPNIGEKFFAWIAGNSWLAKTDMAKWIQSG